MIESFIDRLTDAAVRFKWLAIGLAILSLVAGIFALTQLKQELIPSIEFPQTVVLAFNSSMESEAMRDRVTIQSRMQSRTSRVLSISSPRPQAVWLAS